MSWILLAHENPWLAPLDFDLEREEHRYPTHDALKRRVRKLEAKLELIAAQGYEGDPHIGYCHPEGCSSPGIARDALNTVEQGGVREHAGADVGADTMIDLPDYHSFTPQPDITVWELAQILKVMQVKMTANLVTPEIARHFTSSGGGEHGRD